jgi:hypothetical protein
LIVRDMQSRGSFSCDQLEAAAVCLFFHSGQMRAS